MDQKQIVVVAPKNEQAGLTACFASLGFAVDCCERVSGIKVGKSRSLGLVVSTRTWLDRATQEACGELDKLCTAAKCALLVIGAVGGEKFATVVNYLEPQFDLQTLHEVLRRCCAGYSRKHLRLNTSLPGVLSRSDSSHICEITNLSAGGAFVRTGTPLTAKGAFTLHIPLLGMKRELELGGQVVFEVVPNELNNFQQGAGLQFSGHEQSVEALQAFIVHLHRHRMEQSEVVGEVPTIAETGTGKHQRRSSRERRLTIFG